MPMGIPDPTRDPQFYQGVPARRFVAFLIDTAIIFGLWFMGAVIAAIFVALTAGLAAPLLALIMTGTGFIYRWLLLQQRSATLGMMVTGIELCDRDGQPLDGVTAALHTLGFYMTLFFLPLAVIGWIMMTGAPERRLLHDLPFGTVAINRPT